MTSVTDSQVSDELLERYATLIYDVTGIRMSQQKKTLLSNRLRRRLRATGLESFEKYFLHLKRLRPTDREWDAFLQEITTHETYLFRDEAHWNWLQKTYLPEVASAAAAGARPKQLRIWSAACSTGDEAYSIAASIYTCLPGWQQWKITILGTDIGCDAVAQAARGVFGERAMRLVPEDVKTRCFSQRGEAWQAKPLLQGLTTFRRHNLLEPLAEAPFDLIFLKNVLIYFDAPSKQVVLGNIRKVMGRGTILLAGAAEGIGDMVKDLKRHQAWLYSKT